jgi:hypothetical protein
MSSSKPTNDENALTMYRMRSELERQAEERFAFLVTEKGFRLGRTRHDVFFTAFSYLSADVGVEIVLDFRDQAVDVNLVKLSKGKLPRDGRVDPTTGERIRQPFALFLRDHLHIHDDCLDALFTLYSQRWTYLEVTQVLETLQNVIERYIDMLLQQSLDVLFSRSGAPKT